MKSYVKLALVAALVVAFAGTSYVFAEKGKITVGKPEFKKKLKEDGDWAKRGRIVLNIKNSKGFKLKVFGPSGRMTKYAFVLAKDKTYKVLSLRPGSYKLKIACKGCQKIEVKDIEVKGGTETIMTVEFPDSCGSKKKPRKPKRI